MTFTIRWIFALIAIFCGIYVIAATHGDHVGIGTGVGLIAAGVGLVVP